METEEKNESLLYDLYNFDILIQNKFIDFYDVDDKEEETECTTEKES